MTRNCLAVVMAVGLATSASPAFAQRSGGGESTGTAVSRGDGGSSGGSASSPAPSSGSSSGSSSTWDAPSRPAPAPSRAAERTQGRRPSGERSGDTGSRAVPRGSGGSDAGAASGRTSGTASAETATPARRGEPVTSRTREGRPQIGTAVDRRPGVPGAPGSIITFPPTARYFWPGFGFGLSHFYDPFWYDPFGYGYYGYGGYGPYGYGGYGGYGGGYPATYGTDTYGEAPTGSLRLRVTPSHAEVYVDGLYAGTVSDFNGVFQRLRVEAGTRRIEIRAEGYKPAELDIRVEAGKTAIYQGDLERLTN